MQQQSIVYGYIKSADGFDDDRRYDHNISNRKALIGLPVQDTCSLITRDMFSIPSIFSRDVNPSSHVIHFGYSYQSIEYEWGLWLRQFETLLQKMYWDSVVVHLETELSGTHTFVWDSGDIDHIPSDTPLNVRCEWQHELGLCKERA